MPLKGAHDTLKYMLDVAKLRQPIRDAERAQRENTLRFCLWEVGIAGGALVLHGTTHETIAGFNSWPIKTVYILALVCFIGTVMTATWTYRWYLMTDATELHAAMDAARIAIYTAPEGIGGQFSIGQKEILAKHEHDVQKHMESQRAFDNRLQKLLQRQDGCLYLGLTFMLGIVIQIAIEEVMK